MEKKLKQLILCLFKTLTNSWQANSKRVKRKKNGSMGDSDAIVWPSCRRLAHQNEEGRMKGGKAKQQKKTHTVTEKQTNKQSKISWWSWSSKIQHHCAVSGADGGDINTTSSRQFCLCSTVPASRVKPNVFFALVLK